MFGSQRGNAVHGAAPVVRRRGFAQSVRQRPATEVELRGDALEAAALVAQMQASAIGYVGQRAMEVQANVAARERMIVGMEAGAIHGVAFLGQKVTLGLGAVIDNTVDEVCGL